MRLWTLHPKYLDRAGLLAVWREALLAQKVLQGGTRGYRHHPQLIRFRRHPDPLRAIAFYLEAVAAEAAARGYRFDLSKFSAGGQCQRIPCTTGQLAYERAHLARKLRVRDPACFQRLQREASVEAHPLFEVRAGALEDWERAGV